MILQCSPTEMFGQNGLARTRLPLKNPFQLLQVIDKKKKKELQFAYNNFSRAKNNEVVSIKRWLCIQRRSSVFRFSNRLDFFFSTGKLMFKKKKE